MIIKNKKQLSITQLRKDALDILESGIERVLPKNLLNSVKYYKSKKILKINNKQYKVKGRIFVIGGGKASGLLAEKLEEIIPIIKAGVINCNNSNYNLKKIKVIKACHPIPCKRSIKGVKLMMSLKSRYSINKKDIIIGLISGGASSLMSYPVEDISLADENKINNLLIKSGASIEEINIVRKHISKIKGGQLAKFFFPAKVISLILSDVVGDRLDTIASGVTVPDPSTYRDAYRILEGYKLIDKVPRSIINHLKKGINREIKETPKKLRNSQNFIIGNNNLALESMKNKAESLGFKAYVIKNQEGEGEKTAKFRIKEILEGKYKKYNAIIIGGETTLRIPKIHGKGGRNQHYILVSLNEIEKHREYNREFVIASINTDGLDFVKGVAGAIIDNESIKRVRDKKINLKKYLENYNSYKALKKIKNSLIKTNLTGTNVSDISLYLIP